MALTKNQYSGFGQKHRDETAGAQSNRVGVEIYLKKSKIKFPIRIKNRYSPSDWGVAWLLDTTKTTWLDGAKNADILWTARSSLLQVRGSLKALSRNKSGEERHRCSWFSELLGIPETIEQVRSSADRNSLTAIMKFGDQLRVALNSMHALAGQVESSREKSAADISGWFGSGSRLATNLGANFGLLSTTLDEFSQQLGSAGPKTVFAMQNFLKELGGPLDSASLASAKQELLLALQQALDAIMEKIEERSKTASGVIQSGWHELHASARGLQEELALIFSTENMEKLSTSLVESWGAFLKHSLDVTQSHPAFTDLSQALNRGLLIFEQTRKIVTGVLVITLTSLGFGVLVCLPKLPKLLAAVLVFFFIVMSVVFVGTMSILPVPELWKQNPCPEVLDIIRLKDPNDSKSPLVIDEYASTRLSGLEGPFWSFGESGPFLSGKSTTLSIEIYTLLPQSMRSRCMKAFRARTKAKQSIKMGLTRGVSVIAVPRWLINVVDLPKPMQTPYKDLHSSSTQGTILFIDSQGTNDPDAPAGQSQLVQLLSVLLSSHHTFANMDNFYSVDAMTSLAKIGQLLELTERFSKPVANCAGWQGITMKEGGRPSFSIRVKNGHTSNALSLIDCLTTDADGHITSVQPQCSLLLPFLGSYAPDPTSTQLINKYFSSARAFIQPPTVRDEQQAIWDLQDGKPIDLDRFGEEYGVIYSLLSHHLPFLFQHTPPKLIDGQPASGAQFNAFMRGTFGALNAIVSASPQILSAVDVSSTQIAIKQLMIDIINAWASPERIDSSKGSQFLDLLDQMPLENIVPCAGSSRDDLCPAALADKLFNKSYNTLLASVCIFRSLLDGSTEKLFQVDYLDNMGRKKREELLSEQQSRCTYKWSLTEWSKCNGLCPGTQTRSVGCENFAGQQREKKCCQLFTSTAEFEKRECIPPAYTYKWIPEAFPAACTTPEKCNIAQYPDSGLVPKSLLGGMKTASHVCSRCDKAEPDTVCIEAGFAKPAVQTTRCDNSVFYSSGDWEPSDSVCKCSQTQAQPVACVNCYGETLPRSTCEQRALNSLPHSRPCNGHHWDIDGWTDCSKGVCGTRSQRVRCYACGVSSPKPDAACSMWPKPSPLEEKCNQQYEWKVDSWPATCQCGTVLQRNAVCMNTCSNLAAVTHQCGPQPLTSCSCASCPTTQGGCKSCCMWWHPCSKTYHQLVNPNHHWNTQC